MNRFEGGPRPGYNDAEDGLPARVARRDEFERMMERDFEHVLERCPNDDDDES